jgi:N4-gp56 family major capsid protein
MNLSNQVPTSTPIELTINKGKYFSVIVDDVDEVQADVRLMDIFTNDPGEQMKIAIDNDVLNNVAANVAAANQGATAGAISGNINLGTTGAPVAIDKNNVLDTIINVGQVLDEQNVPEDGRWMVVTPWFASLLKTSDLRQAYLTGDDVSPLRNGKLGMIDRFTLFVSNNINTVAAGGTNNYHFLAGTRDAISFASQITNVESLRSTTTFGNIVRGLNVYGYKVVKPEALVDLYATRA